ncbi:hypothetical protein AOB46_22360 [Chryseobacterium indologenes]|uniref:Uncharacterized protein n=1 Tax=Chryseobacterium indologenes TaxID=253 RepID=A0A0N0ITR8_CHRID|nr:hypothetical protein AOB46_22360 [Chryseobacterium indologenes]
MKNIRRLLITSLLIVFGIIIIFQIKVEVYKSELIKQYNFNYLNKNRIKYTPFVFFFLQSKLFGKNTCYFRSINIPYEIYEKENGIIRKNYEEYYMLYNIEYNAYLMYCYYELRDLKCQ